MNHEKQNTSLLPQKYEAAQRISPLIIIIIIIIMFFQQQIIILERFLKDRVTLKTAVMMHC